MRRKRFEKIFLESEQTEISVLPNLVNFVVSPSKRYFLRKTTACSFLILEFRFHGNCAAATLSCTFCETLFNWKIIIPENSKDVQLHQLEKLCDFRQNSDYVSCKYLRKIRRCSFLIQVVVIFISGSSEKQSRTK